MSEHPLNRHIPIYLLDVENQIFTMCTHKIMIFDLQIFNDGSVRHIEHGLFELTKWHVLFDKVRATSTGGEHYIVYFSVLFIYSAIYKATPIKGIMQPTTTTLSEPSPPSICVYIDIIMSSNTNGLKCPFSIFTWNKYNVCNEISVGLSGKVDVWTCPLVQFVSFQLYCLNTF